MIGLRVTLKSEHANDDRMFHWVLEEPRCDCSATEGYFSQ
jgi:hypothetical protein